MRLNNKSVEAVKLDGRNIEDVDEFTYLGAIISNEGGAGSDMSSRLNKGRNCVLKTQQNLEIKAD